MIVKFHSPKLWNFKINEVTTLITLAGTSMTLKKYRLNGAHMAESTHIQAWMRINGAPKEYFDLMMHKT
jgi:hypothetical protein